MPTGTETLGRYEGWASVVGGMLGVAGVKGFLSNRDQLYDEADHETQEWRAFAEAWWKHCQDKPTTAKTLLEVATENDLLIDLRAGRSALSAQQRLGHALARRRDRVFGKFIIRAADRDRETRNMAYRLEQNTHNTRNISCRSQQADSLRERNTRRNTPPGSRYKCGCHGCFGCFSTSHRG